MSLLISQRQEKGSIACRQLRKKGQVPGVLYGEKKDTVPIAFALTDFLSYLQKKERLIKVKLNEQDNLTMVKEIQYDTFGEIVLHVDFQRIDMDKKIVLRVPLHFSGVPKGVQAGGTLEIPVKEVEVECLPDRVPAHLVVSLVNLEIGQQFRLKDVCLPEGVVLKGTPDLALALVREPMAQPETSAEAEQSEPEVIKKSPKEEEKE